MNVSIQFESVETALNSDRVTPAAKGCCASVSQISPEENATCLWGTDAVFISDMDVLHVYLHVVDDLGDDGSDVCLFR